ncbi:MAG TPA: DinB family protein [Chitinophagaceae bacterium]|nr:DinB family protein [Chitinophagaceae bacterium]
MSKTQLLLKEMQQEARTTRKMLERLPVDKLDWAPHERSMSIRRLATHIAELPSWTAMALNTSELDFASNPYEQETIETPAGILDFFERSLQQGTESLAKAKEEDLVPEWTLRNGDQIYSVEPKGDVIRMSFCQTVHHRAQLGVYLRLLNIPIPGSYGPSADEVDF